MMFGTLTRIVSGGQTGADRGALNAARALSLPIGGWAPQGWRAEDGSIPLELRQYMRESVSPNYGLRTRLNVQDSDGTLILSFANTLTGGSKFTVDQVKAQRKPCKHLVLPRGSGVVTGEVTAALWDWIDEHRIAVLNVAGPRESKERGIQAAVERVIRDLLEAKHRSTLMATMGFDDAKIDAMKDHVFRSAFANHGEGVKEAAKTGVLRMMCPDCGSREPCPCAMRAYATGEVTAANEAMDRKEREVYGSGKYREAGADGVNVIGLSDFLPLRDPRDVEHFGPHVTESFRIGPGGPRHVVDIDIPPVHGSAHLIVDHAAIKVLEADIARISTEIAENLASEPPRRYAPKCPDSDDFPGVTHWAPDGGQLCDYDSGPDDQHESIRFSRVDCMGCIAVGEKYPGPIERYDVADPPVPTPTLDEFVAMLNEDAAPAPQDDSQVEIDPDYSDAHDEPVFCLVRSVPAPLEEAIRAFAAGGPDIETADYTMEREEWHSEQDRFAADCAHAATAEDFTRKRTGLIDRYYVMDGNESGGSLHVVLDDGNHERSSVEFCRDYAIKDGDKAGEALARALLALPDDVYREVLPDPSYCGTCCQDFDEDGKCKCPVQTEGGTDA